MRVLVTGATGFVAGQLIPRLLERGHRVRAMARDPHRLEGRAWASAVEVAAADVLLPASLPAALQGVRTAYYLIHSMASGRGYTVRDVEGAANFARAAAGAGVEHIVYLGGLADPAQDIAPHMRSRVQTGETLCQGPVPVTEFRASVIAGLGSGSFEMIRRIIDLLPLIPGPTSLQCRTQPIAARNVVDYLLAALDNPACRGKVFEIGGPDVTSYRELMLGYARLRGLRRRILLLPHLPVSLMALGTRLLTPVPYATAVALLCALSGDSVVARRDALQTFPDVRLADFATATREALAELRVRRVRAAHARTSAWAGVLQRFTALLGAARATN